MHWDDRAKQQVLALARDRAAAAGSDVQIMDVVPPDASARARAAKLGKNGSIHIFNHRMNHALRVNNHFYCFYSRIKEPACFNDFQPLIHHTG